MIVKTLLPTWTNTNRTPSYTADICFVFRCTYLQLLYPFQMNNEDKQEGRWTSKIFLFRIFTMGLNLPLEGIIHYVNIGNIKYCGGGACEGTAAAQLKSTSQNVSTFHMIIELHGFSNRIWILLEIYTASNTASVNI